MIKTDWKMQEGTETNRNKHGSIWNTKGNENTTSKRPELSEADKRRISAAGEFTGRLICTLGKEEVVERDRQKERKKTREGTGLQGRRLVESHVKRENRERENG